MQKLKIIIDNADIESELDPDDFEISYLPENPRQGRIMKIKKPDKYPKLAYLLDGAKLQNLEYIVFYIKGEQK